MLATTDRLPVIIGGQVGADAERLSWDAEKAC